MSIDLVEAPITGALKLAGNELFDKVDAVLARSISVGDPLIALEYGRELQSQGILRGLAVAKLIYKVNQNWQLYRSAGTDDDFENVVYSVNGYSPATIKKYLNVWESIFETDALSQELKDKLAGRPIGQLLLLSAAASEGSLTEDDWDKVTIASNKHEVRDIVRKARGEKTSSSSAISIRIMSNDGKYPKGTLIAYQNGKSAVIGILSGDGTELANQAMSRIINAVGIQHA